MMNGTAGIPTTKPRLMYQGYRVLVDPETVKL